MKNSGSNENSVSSLETNDGLVYQRRMFSWLFNKRVSPIPADDERRPYFSRNLLSILTFWWCFPVLKSGYKRTITPADLPFLTEDLKVDHMYNRFIMIFTERNMKARVSFVREKCKARGETVESSSVPFEEDLNGYETPTITTVCAIFLTFWPDIFLGQFLCVLINVGSCLLPLLTKKLIEFVSMKSMGLEPKMGKGNGYAIGSAILILVYGFLSTYFMYYSTMSGAKAKAVLTKAILEKSFRVDAKTKHKYPTGVVTAFMSTDMAKIDNALEFLPFGLTFPIPLAVAIAVLAVNIGAPTAVGMGFLLVASVIIGAIGVLMFKFRTSALKFADERINYIKEVVNNLKIIKFYSWEVPYYKTISESRANESGFLLKSQYCVGVIVALAFSLTNLSSTFAFLVLYAISSTRDPAPIFASLALFGILSEVVTMLPVTLGSAIPAWISAGRVGVYLGSSESAIEENVSIFPDRFPKAGDFNQAVIEVENAELIWETFDDEDDTGSKEVNELKTELPGDKVVEPAKAKFTGLKNVNFTINKGEFILVLGSIGTGKTSLLNALAGYMTRTSGNITVNGSILLCGAPWVQNTSFKENVLFGKSLDQNLYDEVIDACALGSDIDILTAGDKTEIGERGINLSGGQKARLSLARAVYADKDIILMDDVLSAVDSRVGTHIMEHCITGMLKDKTRILATHQLPYAVLADRIMFLNGDGTVDFGTFEELKSRNDRFNKLISHGDLSRENAKNSTKNSIGTQIGTESLTKEDPDHATVEDDEGRLIEDESRAVNAIGLDIYLQYLRLGSGKFNVWIILFLYVLTMSLAIFSDLFTNTWLSFWIEEKFKLSSGTYIGLYVMFALLGFCFLIGHLIITAYIVIGASEKLNIYSSRSILNVPMSYMDVTPIGRILNRFTKDTDSLDNEIIQQIIMVAFSLFFSAGVLILCVIYLPWFAISIPPLIFIFIFIAAFYQATAREIKRLEAIQRSFVYNNFNECLTGSDVIKAYNDSGRFINKNDILIDKMNEAYFMVNAVQRWLSIFLGIVIFCFVLLVNLLSVNRVFRISASSAGLVVSYVLSLPSLSTMMIRAYTQLENEMNSVERLDEFAFRLPKEGPYHITETHPPAEWPSKGAIEFHDVCVSYRPELPNVLKNVSIQVQPRERIGVCGRTGAGKSSMTNVLFRIMELNQGTIEIDGIDISTLGLNELRSKLSIIPQEAVLFKGNIRKNLDPFGTQSDDVLWEALRRAGLIELHRLEYVKSQKKGDEDLDKYHLDAFVEDNGSNFSLGERQLIAFARALARNSKILVLDEATSSVDFETDGKIQKTIATEFSNCTILCIAHRLKTIINYNKVLVMDQGEVREYDDPWTLYQKTDSIFRSLCDKAKILPSDFDSANQV